MRRRRLLLCVGAVCLLVVAGYASLLWLVSPTPAVSMENFRHLRQGMSARDVEALLGEPERTVDANRIWLSEEVPIVLTFDEERLMFGLAGPSGNGECPLECISADESFLDRMCRLLHW